MDAGNIFNQIRRDRHVQAMAGHLHLQTWVSSVDVWRALEVQRRQDPLHCLHTKIHAQNAFHLRGAERNTPRRRRLRVGIGNVGMHGATTEFRHEATRTYQGREGQRAVHAAPEALGCFAGQP